MANYTEEYFDGLSWHDCALHGIDFLTGDPSKDDWTNDLALDIDYIAEWSCGVGGLARFHVAPATLVFHGVNDLQVRIDWPDSGYQVALYAPSIDRVERERVIDQKVHLGRPYYAWTIRLNSPNEGVIRFGAVGFTQQLRAEPIVIETQHLSTEQRRT